MGLTSKKSFWIIIVLALVGGAVFFSWFLNRDEEAVVVAVERGDVIKEVFETGTIIRGERSTFGFHTGGRIDRINVEVGDEVSAGQIIAALEDPELSFGIKEARESVFVAEAELERLLAGATGEEVKIYESAVERVEAYGKNLENRLEDAESALEDIKKSTEASLRSGIEDSLSKAKIATETARSAMLEVANLHFVHFYASTHRNLVLLDAKVRANAALLGGGDTGRWNVESIANLKGGIWGDLREVEEELEFEEVEDLLLRTKDALEKTLEALDAIPFSGTLSSVEKDLIQSHRAAVTQQYATVRVALEGLRTLKIESDASVATAEREVRATEDSLILTEKELKEAEARLAQVKAPVREQDELVARARIKQAQASVERLEARAVNNRIVTPVSGTVAKVSARRGEAVSPGVPFIDIIPDKPFQIEMYVYEGDVSDMRVEDSVTIEIVAFPGRSFDGEIVKIEAAGSVIDGVVHYRVLVNPKEDLPQWTFPDMTVDVNTVLVVREDVILVPDSAIDRRDGKVFVKVEREDGSFEDREIVLGMRSADRKIEVLEGLSEGEKVIAE